jgi:hypothetical protein
MTRGPHANPSRRADEGDIAPGIRPVHPSGLRMTRMGQAEAMGRLIRRSTIVTVSLAPIAALSLMIPAAGSAQPLDCQNGQWWDPVGNVCRPPLAPFPPNCGDGQYWNPVANACRPLGQV